MNTYRSRALAVALILDQLVSDPPNRFHPVAWMGTVIAALKRHAPKENSAARFLYGTMIAVGGSMSVAVLGRVVVWGLKRLPAPVNWMGEALILKLVFTLRGLTTAANAVETALANDDMAEARRLVAWHLVSRDTSQLTASQVAAATIESVAENESDGVVAPLFFYAMGGLPGALAYRYLNTTDSMLGYHDERHEWLGKAPARLDDLANLIPARLTAGLLILAAALTGDDPGGGRHIWQRDHAVTASPNAGHPMSAMAGALGVELEKVGHYRLGTGSRQPEATDIRRAVRLVRMATLLAGIVLAILALRPKSEAATHD
ncbi:MAG: cobalamin biosynthesis protein CobD [Chloroflexi bacterium]|nr:cobalamin biosynthesis protein CobD [Chloroflexota bacterium]